MPKSVFASAVDDVQAALRPFLQGERFKVRGRSFNRPTADELVQVVNIQMGAADPPATTPIPGFRKNLHGLFTVNLGVYVPEVARYHGGGAAKGWVQDYHCCVRARLGNVSGDEQDVWWPARADDDVIDDIRTRLRDWGLPFLDQHASRDQILSAWSDRTSNLWSSSPPRIVMAIILAGRGEHDRARELLTRQALETRNPGHPEYIRSLAERLGLGRLRFELG